MAEPWDMRNMNLNEYQQAIKADSNLWWRLASGTQLNLLDEAIDEIERLRGRVDRTCLWLPDDPMYETGCGELFEFTDGQTLRDHSSIRFCPFCGARIIESMAAGGDGECLRG